MVSKFMATPRHTLFEPKSLIEPIQEFYDLPIVNADLLHHGMNDSYSLHSEENDYIFRIVRFGWRTESQVIAELEILNNLANQKFPVISPLPTKNGDLFCHVVSPEGTRPGILFPKAPGNLPKGLNEELCLLMGRMLAQLHLAFDRISFKVDRPHLDINELYEKPLSNLKCSFVDQGPILAELEKTLKPVAHRVAASTRPSNDWGLIHGDFIPVNFFEYRGNLSLFDFDICGPGWRAYDLATLRYSLASYSENPDSEWENISKEYLRAGGQAFQDALIKDLMVLRQLWVWGWNVAHGEDFRRLNLHSFNHHVHSIIDNAKSIYQ